MNFNDFKNKIRSFPLINVQTLKLEGVYNHSLQVQMLRWQKSRKLIKLRNNLYILNSEDRKINPSRLYISSQIYSPSYVSLEYALSLYGLIPEKVADITCITTKKTKKMTNDFGTFVYQHVKVPFFTGFMENKDEENLPYFIASPEKAFVDFVYLNLNKFQKNYREMLVESFRFQNIDSLNKSRLKQYAELSENKKLLKIVQELKSL
ncbi:MAG: hypothetical protein NT145_02430 [Elusimicrobia bacterium]|nr:hypothetical protein [Elusimicrobiota bacterium]